MNLDAEIKGPRRGSHEASRALSGHVLDCAPKKEALIGFRLRRSVLGGAFSLGAAHFSSCRLGGFFADREPVPSRVLPAPSEVSVALLWENAKSGALFQHAAISTERALKGLLVGGSIGFALGVLNGVWRPAEALLDSSLQMLRNVPHLAIIPLVILWFGIDEEAKIFSSPSASFSRSTSIPFMAFARSIRA